MIHTRRSDQHIFTTQGHIHEPTGVYPARLGLTKDRYVLTAEEFRREVDPKRKSLYCLGCWTPHRYDLQLPHVCDRCGHLMLVVRNVLPTFKTGSLTLFLKEARADLLNLAYARTLADMHDQEDARVMAILGDLSHVPSR